MKAKKKMILWLIIVAAAAIMLAAFVWVFMLDSLNVVTRMLGWRADLPDDMIADDSMENIWTVCENDYLYVKVTQEHSPYPDVQEYIDYYFNRFMDNEAYRSNNSITLLASDRKGLKRFTTVRVNNMAEGMEDTYTYLTLRTGTRYFYRVLIKYDSRYRGDEAAAAAERIADSFGIALKYRNHNMQTDFRPTIPENWTDETRRLYETLSAADTPYFGVFTGELDKLEDSLDHKFPIILRYFHLNMDFPLEEMESYWQEGRITELTLQLTVNNNLELYDTSPELGILRGDYDDLLDSIAEDAAAFGHPFLMRLNNEMNSDWTSYSGIVNLSDPDIYVSVWRYIYDHFEKKGVNNAIWIFNPNDNDYPPANWNNALAYYPGNDYVQMFGITGYNTGNYYADVTGESWKSFYSIYHNINYRFKPHFSEFPWIITEFASSSIGGDKAAWIDDMFAHIGDYENIKAAVWFDYADYDYREEYAGNVSRPYWIAENEDTLAAFKRGIAETPEKIISE